jgi:putative transposase
LIYNFALAGRRERYALEGKGISYIDQQNKLPEIKEQYPEYKQVNSKVLQMVLRTLDGNYKSFFTLIKQDPEARPPSFCGRKYFFTMKYNQSGFKVTDDEVQLSHKVEGGAKLVFPITTYERIVDPKQVDVHFNEGKWYLSIIDEIKPPEYHDNELYQAFDLGITKQTAVNMEGKFFELKNIRPDLYWNKTIDKITGRRDHCVKHTKTNCRPSSKKWSMLNSIKRKFEKKRSNQILDFQHKASLMIIKNTKANTIVVGDLDVKSMPQSNKANRGMNRSTQGTGYLARFTGFLTYKAERIGKKVIEISEWNTTKSCCQCGKLHDMPTWKRVMKCDCGNVLDRDRNSAVNIMARFLSQNAMCTGYQQFADNLRTGSGIIISPGYSQEAPSVRVG